MIINKSKGYNVEYNLESCTILCNIHHKRQSSVTPTSSASIHINFYRNPIMNILKYHFMPACNS